jgi:NADH:ubiquinone oxidoreductase subunit 4 (subunit M)
MNLSLAIWMPIVFGIILLGSGSDRHTKYVRYFALIAALLSFMVTLPLVIDFDVTKTGMQLWKTYLGLPVMTCVITWVLMASLFGL